MAAIINEPTTLTGELLAFNQRANDGWGTGVLQIGKTKGAASDFTRDRNSFQSHDEADTVTIAGKVLGARVGDRLILEGVFTEHATWGRQFKIKTCTTTRPEGADGAMLWMQRFPDVGASRARAMVERFAEQLWDVIEHEPERLTEIAGITLARAEAIRVEYLAVAHERESMVKLRGWGLTDNQVGRCKEKWGALDVVVPKLQANPYLLSEEVFGFGFKRADAIAMRMGIKADAPARIRAGIEHVMGEGASNGHCYTGGRALQRMASELLGVGEDKVPAGIRELVREDRLRLRGWRVYARRMDESESRLAKSLRRLMGEERAEDSAEESAA